MKVQTQQSAFQPINIVIETKEELQFFTALLGAVSTNDMKAFGVADYDIYEQLLESLDSDSGEIGFITKLDKPVPESQAYDDFSKIEAGTVILVRDFEGENWTERKFMYITEGGTYVCSAKGDFGIVDYWTLAKLKD